MKSISHIDFKNFPVTRYQGSKRKILPWIYESVKNLEFDTVLDACGGSASVSCLFKKMNKSVTYNDKLKFNSIIGKALIENKSVKFSDDDLTNLLGFKEEKLEFIQKNFQNIYFLRNENKWLDNVASGVINMNHYTGKTLEFKKAIAYYALFQASIIKRPFNLFHRKNLDIRTNIVERNFGNKTTWDKPFQHYFKQFITEANSFIFDSGKPCKSINKSVFDIKETNFDLVYIDPPYLHKTERNETANYLRCYHFLEGIANYDQWENLIDFDTRNLRFKSRQEKTEFNRIDVYNSFDLLLEKFNKSKIVLSYKNGGLPTINFLIAAMKRHKKKVVTRSLQYQYALNRQNDDSKQNREFLIIGS